MNCNLNSAIVSGIRGGKLSKNHNTRSDLDLNDIEMLRNADISACNADELVDLRNVKINRKTPSNRRTSDFIAQTGNPYLFRVDDVIVKIAFGDGKDFSEILTDVIFLG